MSDNSDLLTQTFLSLVSSFHKQNDSEIDYDILNSLLHKSKSREESVRIIRENILQNYKYSFNAITNKRAQIKTIRELNQNLCVVQCNLIRQRLSNQKMRSEKRLKELVFEIIGEYTKSHIRFARRKEYLINDSKTKIALEVWHLRWSRFCMKLSSDIFHSLNLRTNGLLFSDIIRCRQLNTSVDSSELEAAIYKISKQIGLLSDKSYHVMTVVKVSLHPKVRRDEGVTTGASGKTQPASQSGSGHVIRLAEYSSDLTTITEDIQTWLSVKTVQQSQTQQLQQVSSGGSRSSTPANGRRSSESTKQNTVHVSNAFDSMVASRRLQLLLSSRAVEWLHTPSFHPHIWSIITSHHASYNNSSTTNNTAKDDTPMNTFLASYVQQHIAALFNDRVYFCLESYALSERYAAVGNGTVSSDYALFLKALTDTYVKSSTALSAYIISSLHSSSAMQIVTTFGMHRLYTGDSRVYVSNNQSVINMLTSFPDVVQAKCILSGQVLHYAPASVFHITSNLSSSGTGGGDKTFATTSNHTSSEVDDDTAECNTFSPELFTLVISTASINNTNDNTTNDNTINNTQSPAKPNGQSPSKHTTTSPQKLSQQPVIVNNSVEIDQQPTAVYVMPLTPVAVSCLQKYYNNTTSIAHTTITTTVQTDNILSTFELLPDHSRQRTSLATHSVSSFHHHQSVIVRKSRLTYSYLLFSDENTFCVSEGELSARTKTQPCYYLFQLSDTTSTNTTNNTNNITLSGLQISPRPSSSSESVRAEGDNGNYFSSLDQPDSPYTDKHMRSDETHMRQMILTHNNTVFNKIKMILPSVRTTNTNNNNNSSVEGGAPNSSRKSPGNPRGAVAVAMVANSTSGDSSPCSPTKPDRDSWDPLVLSTICRWRSCLCDAAPSTTTTTNNNITQTNTLCVYHTGMKQYLDNKASSKNKGTNEVAKYLPRKAPNFSVLSGGEAVAVLDVEKRDRLTIRAASTLLQELWDSKLGQTVFSFTKKMSVNMSLSHYLSASESLFAQCYRGHYALREVNRDGSRATPLIPTTPSWAKYKNKENAERIAASQIDSLALLDAVLQIERGVTSEVEELLRLNVFPSSELAIIRKEMKLFKESQDQVLAQSESTEELINKDKKTALSANNGYDNLLIILKNEKKVCERKLGMLSARRQEEEENNAIAQRKIARARALQSEAGNQPTTRDPASFRNQGREN